MGKGCLIVILAGVTAIFLMAVSGCALQREQKNTTVNQESSIDISIEAIDTWPDIMHDHNVPVPPEGRIYQSMEYGGLYVVSLTDIDRLQVWDYIKLVKQEGFHEIGGDENEDSGGMLLKQNSTYLHIAYSGTGMSVGISFEVAHGAV